MYPHRGDFFISSIIFSLPHYLIVMDTNYHYLRA